jgi:hypothetical protein
MFKDIHAEAFASKQCAFGFQTYHCNVMSTNSSNRNLPSSYEPPISSPFGSQTSIVTSY